MNLMAILCPSCHATNADDTSFCSNCGRSFTQDSPEEAGGGVCPACHAAYVPGELFCSACGTQLPPVPVVIPKKPEQVNESASLPIPPAAAPGIPGKLVLRETGAVVEFPQGKTDIVVGRSSTGSGDIPDIDCGPFGGGDKGVSRRHARILFQSGQLMVEDLGSTNFTYLNRQKLQPNQPYNLKIGDELRFGNLIFIFQEKTA
jgi:hypothetical protein